MKNTILILFSLLIVSTLGQDIFPPTLPQFQNANLTFKQGSYKLITNKRQLDLIPIPDVLQNTAYSCGPSSMKAVLHSLSLDIKQSDIMKASGSVPFKGTGPTMLQNGFKKITQSKERNLEGILNFYRKQNMTTEELQKNLRERNPVIVLLQIFKAADNPTSYKDYNERGHYIVAIGMDDERYYFEDPKVYNSIMYINKSQFYERWHDFISSQGRIVNRVGIVITFKDGHKPKGQQKLRHLVE